MPSRTLHPSRRPSRITERTFAGVAIAAALALGVAACRRSEPLPVLGAVPAFALTERSGKPLTANDLAGHVWIADFVFTRCPDFCPALTARMGGLQKSLLPTADGLRLVSFSVDPEHDTPEVLRTYATRAGAGDRWLFATGPRDRVSALLRDGFKVAWADNGPPSSPITHSDRFILVDRELRIRGYYHGTDADDLRRLAADARALEQERAS